MKPLPLAIAALAVVIIAFVAFQNADGPAENLGEAVDEIANDAARTVEDAAD